MRILKLLDNALYESETA